ncbi:uncharacterized protein KY384_008750 [Bacidia gigantensis]|uniref:uncharacterized protein n=1 Tax=Bacidia gigantensis TaxID=2732470 RepID=UPI001D040895|nr:uncharacterized protein KY384_008750 [Bacidia gigantensis]KAG8526549.1 hypothetical protein KY384_008750 [Bacidia gigantensis]
MGEDMTNDSTNEFPIDKAHYIYESFPTLFYAQGIPNETANQLYESFLALQLTKEKQETPVPSEALLYIQARRFIIELFGSPTPKVTQGLDGPKAECRNVVQDVEADCGIFDSNANANYTQ